MKKVQFEFTDETHGAIKQLATTTGATSMAAVIRDALKVYSWLLDEQRHGRKILSVDPKDKSSSKELVHFAVTANV